MFVVCEFDFLDGHKFICKVEDVNRGIEIADSLVTSRFDEYAVYTEENFEKLVETNSYVQTYSIPCEYITGQYGFERNC